MRTNMQKLVFAALLVALCFVLGACGGAGSGADGSRESTSEQGSGASEQAQSEEEAYTMQELSFSRDGQRIAGELFLPKGEGPHPAVVLAHGFGGDMSYTWEYAQTYAKNGIAAYVFDFIGGGPNSKSGGKMTEMSVLTEAADMDAVLDGIRGLGSVDADRVFLFGGSQGGFVATYLAASRPQDVRGLVALYPAYVLQDDARERTADADDIPEEVDIFGMTVGRVYLQDALSFDIYDTMLGYDGPVLIVHGTADSIVPISYSERAADVLPDAELVRIEGAGHGFNGSDRDRAAQLAVEFVQAHL